MALVLKLPQNTCFLRMIDILSYPLMFKQIFNHQKRGLYMNTPQQNLSLIRRLFDEVYNKGNIAALDSLAANNIRINDPAAHRKEGLHAYKEMETLYCKAFPNKKVTLDDLISSEDKVTVRWTCKGSHTGDLQEIAATNRSFQISGISIYRITNNKISEIWQSWDRLGLLEQLGEIQPAHALH